MKKVLVKKFFNGLILIIWLGLSTTTGTLGWVIIETYSDKISSSHQYKALIKTYRDRDESLFLAGSETFKTKKDMLAYLKQKGEQSKGVSDTSQETSGFTYGDVTFKTEKDMLSYTRKKRFTVDNILDWFIQGGTPQRILIIVLAAFSFGVIGSITDIINSILTNKEKLENVKIFLRPLFSGLLAFMILGIAQLLPVIFQTNTDANVIRPVSLFFFCLFGGFMSEDIFKWGKKLITDMLKIKTRG
jgi:hypothetical protein